MSRYPKIVFSAIALLVAALLGFYIYVSIRPLEKQIMAADRLEFIGELPIPDGGSYVFHFRLPYHRPLAMKVRHRRADLGGNPDFQEIWLDPGTAMNPHIDVNAGSEIETKLVGLLRTATCNSNAGPKYLTPPTPERLSWAIERIQDRKTRW